MKTANTNLPDDKAKKEIVQFCAVAVISTIVSVFMPFLAVVGLATGARTLVLSKHTANKANTNNTLFRIAAIVALLISTSSFIRLMSS